jgi:hypothetical protein
MYCEKLFNSGKLGKIVIKYFKTKVAQSGTNKSQLGKEPLTLDVVTE